MAVFLCGQGVGPCQCFDGLPDLLDQCMCLPVLLVDHLQSPCQLRQQRVEQKRQEQIKERARYKEPEADRRETTEADTKL